MSDREEFEKQMEKQAPNFNYEIMFSTNDTGHYTSLITNHCWQAWQARGELDAGKIADLKNVIVNQGEMITALEVKLYKAKEALKWIDKVNAMDSEYVRVARQALEELNK